jgi:hypothetical protein
MNRGERRARDEPPTPCERLASIRAAAVPAGFRPPEEVRTARLSENAFPVFERR